MADGHLGSASLGKTEYATQVLRDTEATGTSFKVTGGDYAIWVVGHAGGTWTLEMDNAAGGWASTEVALTDEVVNSIWLAERRYRLTGGTVGARAWIQRMGRLRP